MECERTCTYPYNWHRTKVLHNTHCNYEGTSYCDCEQNLYMFCWFTTSLLPPPLQTWFSLHCSGTGVWPPQQQKSVTPPGPFSPHEAEALQTDHLKQQGNWSSNASKSLNHTTYSSQAPGMCPSLSICTAFCLSIRLSVYPSVCPSIYLSVSVQLSVYPSVCLSLYLGTFC